MLRLNEVAERLKCSLSNVHNLVTSGRLPALSTGAGGKGYRVTEEDLAAFIAEGKLGHRTAPFAERTRPRRQSAPRNTEWF